MQHQHKTNNYIIDLRKNPQGSKEIRHNGLAINFSCKDRPAPLYTIRNTTPLYYKVFAIVLLVIMFAGPTVRIYAMENEESGFENILEGDVSPETIVSDNLKNDEPEKSLDSFSGDEQGIDEFTGKEISPDSNNGSGDTESLEDENNEVGDGEDKKGETPIENDFIEDSAENITDGITKKTEAVEVVKKEESDNYGKTDAGQLSEQESEKNKQIADTDIGKTSESAEQKTKNTTDKYDQVDGATGDEINNDTAGGNSIINAPQADNTKTEKVYVISQDKTATTTTITTTDALEEPEDALANVAAVEGIFSGDGASTSASLGTSTSIQFEINSTSTDNGIIGEGGTNETPTINENAVANSQSGEEKPEEVIDSVETISLDDNTTGETLSDDEDGGFESSNSSSSPMSNKDTNTSTAPVLGGTEEFSSGASTPSNQNGNGELDESNNEKDENSASGAQASNGNSTDDPNNNTTNDMPSDIGDGKDTKEYVAHNSFFNNDSKYVFNDKECVLVRDNEFYCIKGEEEAIVTPEAVQQDDGTVFVEQDSDGDKEVFLNTPSGVVKVTNNLLEDDAPAYDQESGFVVWHSLVQGRYQIMLYDISSGESRQITHTSFNNTNPQISGTIVVWQGWVGNDWEIFATELSLANEPTIIQITDNSYNDMFPKVYKGLITWQAFIGNSWEAFMHDFGTGKISRIGKSGEGSIESPRFILLLDKRKENGDVEKIGYDVSSGKKIDLGTVPKNSADKKPSLPDDPLQDQERALPTEFSGTSTPKTSQRSEGEGGE